MTVSVIHISDIHIKSNYGDNHILKKQDKIFESVRNLLTDSNTIVIAVTGDIAFSGKKVEYDFAKDFFKGLVKKINDYTTVETNIVFIPGNHDCDFSSDQTIRDIVIKQTKESWFKNINEGIITECCKVQTNYFDFEKEFQSNKLKKLLENKLLNIYDLQLDKFNLVLNCFNTSWISKLNEEEGQMAFPTGYFSDDMLEHKSNLTLNLIHHPINWLNNVHHREFRKLLEETGDLILSGHEHSVNQREVSEKGGYTTTYLEAGALQDNIATVSNFNIYKFDLEKATYTYYEFQLDSGNYIIATELKDLIYDHRFNLNKKEFCQNLKFASYLNSTDALFTHTQTEQVYLSDIYVYPKLRQISFDESDGIDIPQILDSRKLLSPTIDEIHIAFVGNESSGKTALSKVLYQSYYDKDYVPIYIKGDDLTDISVIKLKKIIKELFLDQYDKKCETKFDNLDNKRLVLIIDNFQNCSIKGKFRIKLLESLNIISKNLVFTGNTMLLFESITDEKAKKRVDSFKDYKIYNILEFGANLRCELINNWNKIGKDLTDEEDRNRLYAANDSYDEQIRSTLGNNYIPSHPFYILTLLHAIDSGKSNADYSLNGYYYDYLINNSLNDTVSDKDSLQFYNQFLSEFFYFLFTEKMKNITLASFIDFHSNYCKKYEIMDEVKKLIRELGQAKILRTHNNSVTFTYRYVYYYFVARHFANKISDPYYKTEIAKMCKRLYREEFSHIIVFLTHLSKDPFIMKEIYLNAKEQFSDIDITKLENDILNINKLVDDIPKLVLDGKSVEENRAAKYISQAEEEELEKEFEASRSTLDYDVNEDINSIDTLSKMIRSIKTYELLGQVTKKYWGSIEGEDKYIYAKETFDLALRTLNFYFQSILEYKEGIIATLQAIANKKQIDSLTEIKEITNAYIFKLCCLVSQGSINRVSISIGHKKLKETFAKIVENEPNNAYKIIDLAIKLEHLNAFPIDEIEKLVDDKTFNNNFLPKYLVQNLIYNHLTLFATNFKEKQQIFDKLEIKMSALRQADFGSEVKK